MKMFVYTVLTACITSGWWVVPFPIGNELGFWNLFVGTLLTATILYLTWLGIVLFEEWD